MPNIFDQVLHIKINSFHQVAIFHVINEKFFDYCKW